MTTHLHLWQGDPIPICQGCRRTPNASPSQLEAWGREPRTTGCRRKWAYRRRRPRTSESKYQAFGTKTHKHLENRVRHGTWTPEIAASPEGKTLAAALHHFPAPGEGVGEHEVHVDMLGIRWIMKIDALSQYVPGYSVRVQDLKTTGDLRNAKSEADLLEDPQRLAYAYWAATTLEVDYVETQWVYAKRFPKPACTTVTVVEHRDLIIPRFERMHHADVVPMIRANATPLDAFPRDGLSNGECNRCDHRKECHAPLNPLDLLNARMAR